MTNTLCLITDAWEPQTNGVVQTLKQVTNELEKIGLDVKVLHPNLFSNRIKLWFYPEIEVVTTPWEVNDIIDDLSPDFIHIATESTLGFAARGHCVKNNLKFSTSFHTLFPEYLNKATGFPVKPTYSYFRWFHSAAEVTLVPTPHLKKVLETQYGFKNLRLWGRGVDTDVFNPKHFDADFLKDCPRPFYLYVGRISVEKSVEDFCSVTVPGTKIVVGDGPLLNTLKTKYPDCVFLGKKTGLELSKIYASCDVFVFPSKTDTFGLVLLEALASGLPVAAYPIPSPSEIIENGKTGILSPDLRTAMLLALDCDKTMARQKAEEVSWEHIALRFFGYLPRNQR